MPETSRTESQAVNPEVRHEWSDASARGLLWFAATAAVFGIIILMGLAFMLREMKASEDRAKPGLRPIIAREREKQGKDFIPSLAPEKRRQRIDAESGHDVQPRLQSDPVDDLEVMRAWEDRELSKGRISIDKAMRLLADPIKAKSLGVGSRKEGAEEQPSTGTANSGRKVGGKKP